MVSGTELHWVLALGVAASLGEGDSLGTQGVGLPAGSGIWVGRCLRPLTVACPLPEPHGPSHHEKLLSSLPLLA